MDYDICRRSIKTEEKAKVVGAVWGTELIQFLAALQIQHWDGLKKSMNRIEATWWNGCFDKWNDHQVHTIPNHHHPTKLDGIPKTLVQIILMAFKYVRQTTATTFAFSTVFILRLWTITLNLTRQLEIVP